MSDIQFTNKPLHQVNHGDTIAYYQHELIVGSRRNGYREGLYEATVISKDGYQLRLTTGTLSHRLDYRVVNVPTGIERVPLVSRPKPTLFKGVSID